MMLPSLADENTCFNNESIDFFKTNLCILKVQDNHMSFIK